jgi:hypothetical protein
MALQSIALLLFTFLFTISVTAFLSGGNTAVITIILALVSIPIFLTSLFLAIKSSLARDPWGYASALLHIAIIAGFLLFTWGTHLWNTPERQAAREAKLRARWAERQMPRQPRYFDVAINPTFYKPVASPTWRIASVVTLAAGLILWFVPRFRRTVPPHSDNNAEDICALDVKCPICKANIGRILVIGETSCPSCHTQFSPGSVRLTRIKYRTISDDLRGNQFTTAIIPPALPENTHARPSETAPNKYHSSA